MRLIFALCLAAASSLSPAQTYRWTDSTGRTVISDAPPAGRQAARILPAESSETAPPRR